MVELYNGFIKILGMKELSMFCSLMQFALQYDSQDMPDLGGMKTTTLRHMAQRKGISLQFLLPQILDSWGCPGDGRQAIRELFAQVLIEATSSCNCLDLLFSWHMEHSSQLQQSKRSFILSS